MPRPAWAAPAPAPSFPRAAALLHLPLANACFLFRCSLHLHKTKLVLQAAKGQLFNHLGKGVLGKRLCRPPRSAAAGRNATRQPAQAQERYASHTDSFKIGNNFKFVGSYRTCAQRHIVTATALCAAAGQPLRRAPAPPPKRGRTAPAGAALAVVMSSGSRPDCRQEGQPAGASRLFSSGLVAARIAVRKASQLAQALPRRLQVLTQRWQLALLRLVADDLRGEQGNSGA